MFALSHVLYALVFFYGGISVLILRQALRPSCRVCLHRHRCPNRLRGNSQFVEIPVCCKRTLETQDPAGSIRHSLS